MPTPDFLDFDSTSMPHYDEARTQRALIDYPEVYVNHLRLAQHLARWADRVGTGAEETSQMAGFADALREVSRHLRQADYMPGGELDG